MTIAGAGVDAGAGGARAGDEGIAGEAAGAGADGDVVAHRALGVDAARRRARTDAPVVQAHLVRSAVDTVCMV